MKCTRCEYPLWNLKDRRCPECGQDFAPSQFRFVPRAVRFRCPHCDQEYFGTGVHGHLVPRVFDCTTCSAHIHMDEMVLSPVDESQEAAATIEIAPWLRPREQRFLSRWFRTLGGGMGVPKRHIRQIPIDSSVIAALWFATFTTMVAAAIGLAGLAAIMGVASVAGRGGGGGNIALVLAVLFILVLIVLGVWLTVWILVTHVILAITGRTAGGLRRTAQCLAYASAPNILYALPCLNFYLWPVVALWSTITGSIMLIHGQKVSSRRAILAAATPPLILGTAIAAFIIGVIVPAIQSTLVAARTAAMQAGVTLQTIRVQSLCTSLNANALSSGAYPAHAVALLETGLVSASEFSLSSNPMAGPAAVVGKTTLGAIESLPPARRTAAISEIVASQPADVIAHRIGDCTFTYHGLTPGTADRGLWVFIAEVPAPAPPPSAPSSGPGVPVRVQAGIQPSFIAATVGDQIIPISASGFTQALAEQNDLRKSYGLPPLPDPTTVLPSSPALQPK